MSFKVAFIGAGSLGFTRGLLRDLLSVPEFSDIQIASVYKGILHKTTKNGLPTY